MSELVMKVEHVGASYKRRKGILRTEKFWALKDISFELYHGETLGIVGKNGVGKSTLLRLLAGIIQEDKGKITRYGDPVVSLLSLKAGFIGHLTGIENAILSGMLLGISKEEIKSRLDEIKEFSGLGDFIYQPVKTYSSGMKARLGFSVAHKVDPDVILIDETLGVGDADFRKKSSKVMREKIQSNHTIVLVSHNAEMVKKLCDRAVWIEDGVVKGVGDPEEIVTKYSGLPDADSLEE